jgi:predicted N-acyltransferase
LWCDTRKQNHPPPPPPPPPPPRGLDRVEAGAQGGHKLARGYEPVRTWSAHWIADPGFREAVADFLERERQGVAQESLYLGTRTPFRKG